MKTVDLMDLEPGFVLQGGRSRYELLLEISEGANRAFQAKNVDTSEKVFLKVYDNFPRASNPRFPVFKTLQEEINRRLTDLKSMTEILTEDFLIDNLYYCSVKSWVDGKSASKIIEQELESLEKHQALGLGAVFIGVLGKVNEKKIVHTDLKPGNLFCEKDPSIALLWKLKIIDFDFSHIEGMEPFETVGTPLYLSPEHLSGERPTCASDIFTAGIILAEMFTGGYIYDLGDEDDGTKYRKAVMAHNLSSPVMSALKAGYKQGSQLSELIRKMLSPKAKNRPLINDVHDVLTDAHTAEKVPARPAAPEILEIHGMGQKIIVFEDAKSFKRENFYVFGRDNAAYVSKEKQFDVVKTDSGWKLIAHPGTTNPTFLNGRELKGGEEIIQGDDKLQIGPLEFTLKLRAS